ncbi:MAG: DUF3365 domain-containing protein, partial [Planctomycetes bacterium]|nr:DUF3365 domain-containing protein [Planctomycetota bacterium]
MLFAAAWTLVIGGFAWTSFRHDWREAQDLARNTAVSHLDMNQVFRNWGASHGGVYVLVSELAQPNPTLAHVPERDVLTPSGRTLTLVSPAGMLRRVMDQFRELHGVRGRIASSTPLRPENLAGDWEREALRSFEGGATEAAQLSEIEGAPYLRVMRPLVAEAACLDCHQPQEFQAGEIRGGVGISVPLEPLYQHVHARNRGRLAAFGLIWLVGLGGLALSAAWVKRRGAQTRQAIRELDQARVFQRTVLDQVPEMVMVINRDFTLELANKAVRDFYGVDPVGSCLCCYQLMHHREAPCEQAGCPMAQILVSGQPMNATHVHTDVNGRERRLEMMAAPIFDAEGRVVQIVEACRDITDRLRAEEERIDLERQMLHAQKLESLGVLAGGIAHDFNNLLMAILGNADLAMLDPSTPAETMDRLREIEAASKRAACLTAQMLAYSGKGSFAIEPVDLGEVVLEMRGMLGVSISKKAELRLELAEDLPAFLGDPAQIRQVIMNLITNASESLEERGGTITISTGVQDFDLQSLSGSSPGLRDLDGGLPEPGRYVYVTVEDTGCGMDEETRERLFDPFFTTKFTGRGLGMAAVLGIVRGHLGGINVSSVEGRGSVFRVMFPVGEEVVAAAPAAEAAAQAGSARPAGEG